MHTDPKQLVTALRKGLSDVFEAADAIDSLVAKLEAAERQIVGLSCACDNYRWGQEKEQERTAQYIAKLATAREALEQIRDESLIARYSDIARAALEAIKEQK